jgi:hypothetical protein
MGGGTIYRTLSPKRTPFQTGTDRWPHLQKVNRRRWISHTYPTWLWSHSLLKISSPGLVLHGTKWHIWRPHKQSPTFHSRCRINRGLIKRGSTIYHRRSRCKGRILWPTPHTYIHSLIHLCQSGFSHVPGWTEFQGKWTVLLRRKFFHARKLCTLGSSIIPFITKNSITYKLISAKVSQMSQYQ